MRNALANITDEQVATILKHALEPKALLQTVVSKITLDPDTYECQIQLSVAYVVLRRPQSLWTIGRSCVALYVLPCRCVESQRK